MEIGYFQQQGDLLNWLKPLKQLHPTTNGELQKQLTALLARLFDTSKMAAAEAAKQQ